jgi:hypothetical protein
LDFFRFVLSLISTLIINDEFINVLLKQICEWTTRSFVSRSFVERSLAARSLAGRSLVARSFGSLLY